MQLAPTRHDVDARSECLRKLLDRSGNAFSRLPVNENNPGKTLGVPARLLCSTKCALTSYAERKVVRQISAQRGDCICSGAQSPLGDSTTQSSRSRILQP
jgi:hypothetical protein